MKKLHLSTILLFLMISLSSCSMVKDNTDILKDKLNDVVTSIVEDKDQLLKDKLLEALSSHDNVTVNCEITKDRVNFTVCQDGVANTAIKAKEGDEDSYAKWEENEMIYKNASDTLLEIADYYGLGEKSFRFSVLNDLNKSNALLMFENGYLIYDYVRDINFVVNEEQ